MSALLSHLLAAPSTVENFANVQDWLARHATISASFANPLERAIAGGHAADRLGYVFVSGYCEALRQLFVNAEISPTREAAALCATEEGGAHPRNIKTQLVSRDGAYVLRGAKQMVTFGPLARVLYVVASEGADAQSPDRNRLAMVRIPVEDPAFRSSCCPIFHSCPRFRTPPWTSPMYT